MIAYLGIKLPSSFDGKMLIFKIGDTALHTMVRQDRLDCALALITHGAEIDAKDNEVRFIFDDKTFFLF